MGRRNGRKCLDSRTVVNLARPSSFMVKCKGGVGCSGGILQQAGSRADSVISFIVLNTADKGRSFHVQPDSPAVIGRKGTLELQDSRVSRQHALISHDRGRWTIKDVGSSNGTFVNHRRIQTVTPLHEGDQIQVGRVLMVVGHLDAVAAKPEAAPPTRKAAEEVARASAALTPAVADQPAEDEPVEGILLEPLPEDRPQDAVDSATAEADSPSEVPGSPPEEPAERAESGPDVDASDAEPVAAELAEPIELVESVDVDAASQPDEILEPVGLNQP